MRKSLNIKTGFILFIAIAALLLQSCSDEETFDVVGDKENKVYINMQLWTPVDLPSNSVRFNVTKTPVGSFLDGTESIVLKFPVKCTHVASNDIKVKFEIDKISDLDGFSGLPDGVTVKIINNELTIPKGSMSSKDSITVSLESESLELLSSNVSYVVPVKIASVSNASISSNLSSTYLVLKTEYSNCVNLATSISGTALTGRTSWLASLDVALSSGSLANMFDARTNTYWFVSPAKECQLTVNLTTLHTNITGIRIHSYGTSYSLNAIEVSSSVDGENWVNQGNVTLSTATAYQYIRFYEPINAQYIRLKIKGWRSASYVIISEFDVYVSNE